MSKPSGFEITPDNGKPNRVGHLTCYYWAKYGRCKHQATTCRYAHFDTGMYAEQPIRLRAGEPAMAGSNLRRNARSVDMTPMRPSIMLPTISMYLPLQGQSDGTWSAAPGFEFNSAVLPAAQPRRATFPSSWQPWATSETSLAHPTCDKPVYGGHGYGQGHSHCSTHFERHEASTDHPPPTSWPQQQRRTSCLKSPFTEGLLDNASKLDIASLLPRNQFGKEELSDDVREFIWRGEGFTPVPRHREAVRSSDAFWRPNAKLDPKMDARILSQSQPASTGSGEDVTVQGKKTEKEFIGDMVSELHGRRGSGQWTQSKERTVVAAQACARIWREHFGSFD